MEIWKWLTQRDRVQQSARKDTGEQPVIAEPSKEQKYWEGLSPAEREAITKYITFLQEQRVQLEGVGLLVLGVGSYARKVHGDRVTPRDIDLRVVSSAPSESEMQERVVRSTERLTKDYLDAQDVIYTQTSGFNWHLVKAGSGGEVTTIPFVDYDPQDIRFVVDAEEGRRAIDIIISGHLRPDIEGHLAKRGRTCN